VHEVVQVARRHGADTVHVSADFGPHGHRRDEAVEAALAEHGIALVRTGSPYAVDPGTIVKQDGEPFRVYTPFSRAWAHHGHAAPEATPRPKVAAHDRGEGLPRAPRVDAELPEAGEAAALAVLDRFLDERVDAYAEARDRPATPGTSRLSPHLRWGSLHPRTVLARLGRGKGEAVFRSELVWREFYADVLWHRPESARGPLDPVVGGIRADHGKAADERFAAWAEGRTGYPIVDAGMRQLRQEAWVHNRVRMIVASFLLKDLHLPWERGARFFMQHLVDGDLASNQHGWQWVAGCGTDAVPYFRVFNPVTQGKEHDPAGDYVARYVPELAHLSAKERHEPWLAAAKGADLHGYPDRVVDHKAEREEALRRYAEVRGR
jgi:deoxyribodipyrimidine photo-lyase